MGDIKHQSQDPPKRVLIAQTQKGPLYGTVEYKTVWLSRNHDGFLMSEAMTLICITPDYGNQDKGKEDKE